MMHIRPAVFAGLGIVCVLSGCKKDPAVDPKVFAAEINKYRVEQTALIDSTNASDARLNSTLNQINARVDKLQQRADSLNAVLAAYQNVPDVRLEIIPEVTSRFQIVSNAQTQWMKSIRDSITAATASQDTVNARVAAMQNMLNEHMAFVQFVATEQDSINRVFANKIDTRPWYVSFMGKWEDRQRAHKSANP